MKSLIAIVALVFVSTTVLAEEPYNPFQESFDNMFYIENPVELLDTSAGPPPPVPLDGGLVALLVAGGAAGYGRFRNKRT